MKPNVVDLLDFSAIEQKFGISGIPRGARMYEFFREEHKHEIKYVMELPVGRNQGPRRLVVRTVPRAEYDAMPSSRKLALEAKVRGDTDEVLDYWFGTIEEHESLWDAFLAEEKRRFMEDCL